MYGEALLGYRDQNTQTPLGKQGGNEPAASAPPPAHYRRYPPALPHRPILCGSLLALRLCVIFLFFPSLFSTARNCHFVFTTATASISTRNSGRNNRGT
jgi:hypothetical protein